MGLNAAWLFSHRCEWCMEILLENGKYLIPQMDLVEIMETIHNGK